MLLMSELYSQVRIFWVTLKQNATPKANPKKKASLWNLTTLFDRIPKFNKILSVQYLVKASKVFIM